MTDLKPLKKAVKKAYKLLPTNCKMQAAKRYGCSSNYFRSIVKGDPLDQETYIKALKAIRYASLYPITELQKNRDKIDAVINEVLPTETTEKVDC